MTSLSYVLTFSFLTLEDRFHMCIHFFAQTHLTVLQPNAYFVLELLKVKACRPTQINPVDQELSFPKGFLKGQMLKGTPDIISVG